MEVSGNGSDGRSRRGSGGDVEQSIKEVAMKKKVKYVAPKIVGSAAVHPC
jgi:hypothetical protein